MTTRGRRSAATNRRRTPLSSERIRYERIIQRYLGDCYAKRTVARVSELADLLDANRQHLSEKTRVLFGRPLAVLMRERQIEEAKRLLRLTPAMTLDEIAAASALGHRSTLHRHFIAAVGLTPAEYRNRGE